MRKKPEFDVALAYWENLLQERNLSPNLRWVFRENIFNSFDETSGHGKLVFETQINPVTLDDVRLVYGQAQPDSAPLVLWALVQTHDFTLCTVLGDTLSTCDDVFVDEWNLYFYAQKLVFSFEEVTTPEQWAKAKKHEWIHLSELDYVFCLDAFRKRS